MQRYEHNISSHMLEPHVKGPWVKYETAAARISELEAQLEIERMKLVACGVAALSNTPESAKEQRIDKDSQYWCASYQDVCDAVDREMLLRKQLAAAQERERWIPVTERLPEFSMQTKKCQVVIEAEFCGGEFYDKDGEWIREDVTHWRELPAPPEADHAAE